MLETLALREAKGGMKSAQLADWLRKNSISIEEE
jgi:hypothetical protein